MKHLIDYILENHKEDEIEKTISDALSKFGNIRNGFKPAKIDDVIDALKNDAYCFDVKYDEKKHQITAGINLSNNADGDDYTVIIYGKEGDNTGKITIHNWNIML